MNAQAAAFAKRINALGYEQQLMRQEPMKRYTSYAIGGPADLLMIAHKTKEIQDWVIAAKDAELAYCVLGGGTNILVADAGIRGLVIINDCMAKEINQDGLLIADTGYDLAALAHWTISQGWDGLTWAAGVPGTLGGAIVGNAGAYGGCMADSVCWVSMLTAKGQIEQWQADSLRYQYRNSSLKGIRWDKGRPIVLQAALQMRPGDAAELALTAQAINAKRRQRTPTGACAGSVFKRTLQYPAGYLIDQAGLKGMSVGGAIISPKHANFVMNTGNATAHDVRTLIEKVHSIISEQYGIRLEREIEFVGEWQGYTQPESVERP